MLSNVSDISNVIRLAVAPVFLLTAIATIINVLNVRLSRLIDRRRVILERIQMPQDAAQRERFDVELRHLWNRGRIIYRAIFCAVLSGLLVCLVVGTAFVGAMIATDIADAVAVLFILAMLALIAGLGLFLREVFVAVQLQQELETRQTGLNGNISRKPG